MTSDYHPHTRRPLFGKLRSTFGDSRRYVWLSETTFRESPNVCLALQNTLSDIPEDMSRTPKQPFGSSRNHAWLGRQPFGSSRSIVLHSESSSRTFPNACLESPAAVRAFPKVCSDPQKNLSGIPETYIYFYNPKHIRLWQH